MYLKFQHCAITDKIDSKLKPCLDVPTRWNSTFFMLERALIYQKDFERLEEEDNLNVVVDVREDELGVDNANDIGLEVDRPIDIMESGIGQGKGRGKQPIIGTPSIDD
ncbi:hypothetical protein Vadar_028380 [Vaccinium darrowii]|uniref:Uncharacterized protein n=1 Tax=Vaccinium darrowii TaxID=229202 RepID=A0ACB7XVA3_9ERIC|nr:hypothetical protein Vadar_028380 [Vaccinium darrowii]